MLQYVCTWYVTPSSDQTRSCIDRGILVFALSLASFSIVMPARLATFSFLGCSTSIMHSNLAFPTFLESANTLSCKEQTYSLEKQTVNKKCTVRNLLIPAIGLALNSWKWTF